MNNEYFTFGSDHRAIIDMKGLPITADEYNPKYCDGHYLLLDESMVLEVPNMSAAKARELVFELIGPKFAFQYPEAPDLKYFRGGVITIPASLVEYTLEHMGGTDG